jgi:hypothetical protein
MQRTVYRIDLARIEGEGEFPCPYCGELFSPDDMSGMVYDVVYVERTEYGKVREASIVCKKCRSTIILVGFEALADVILA